MCNHGNTWVPDATYQVSRSLVIWFWGRKFKFLKVFTIYEHGGHIGHMALNEIRFHLAHLCTEKLSRTCCACSRGGSLIRPHTRHEGEIVTRPCCKRSRCGTTFQCTNFKFHLCNEKLSRTCCACSRGGSLFLPCALKSCPAPVALAAGAGHYFSLTAYNLTF